jgi:transcriptional regulator with XRE-family HTH domain
MGKVMGETIHVGRRIKERVAQMPELTAKALASKMNMHEQTLYDVYRRSSVDTDKLLMFSEILKVPLTYFFTPYDDGKENKPSAPKPETTDVRTHPPITSASGAMSMPAGQSESTATLRREMAHLSAEANELKMTNEKSWALPEQRGDAGGELRALREEVRELRALLEQRGDAGEELRALREEVRELRALLEQRGDAGEELRALREENEELKQRRIRELEGLNQERAVLFEALLKRYL